jgi:hypothetical protein
MIMTLNEFLTDNIVTEFEYIEKITIINAVVGETIYGIDVDTSNINSGTLVTRTTDYVINGDFLTIGNLELNILTTNML